MYRFLMILLAMFLAVPMSAKEIETQKVENEQKIENTILANAKCFADVAQYMTLTEQFLTYSECDDKGAFDAYFDLLLYSNSEYFILEKDGETYLVFLYVYEDYGDALKKINDVKKVEQDGSLHISVSKEIRELGRTGCEPDVSYCKCILRLDQPFDKLMVESCEYMPYDGGMIYVMNHVGILDENLNIIVPIEYDHIWRYPIYAYDHAGSDSLRVYYKASGNQGTALLDEQYHFILQPVYRTIYYVSDNCFLVTTPASSSAGLSDSKMMLVDAKGNVLSDEMEGWISDSYSSFTQTYARQLQFSVRDGKDICHGVLDENLNTVIEPIYEKITTFGSDTDHQFYVVENKAGKFAVFDIYGKQQTEFEKTSVYEVQTAYYERITGRSLGRNENKQ